MAADDDLNDPDSSGVTQKPKLICAGLRKCTVCKTFKTTDEFNKREKGWFKSKCKICDYAQIKIWRVEKQTKEMRRNVDLKSKYGISLQDFYALLESQGHVCALCHTDDPKNSGTWSVDHCHYTGKIRGLLCSGCNSSLGGYEKMLRLHGLDKISLYLQNDSGFVSNKRKAIA